MLMNVRKDKKTILPAVMPRNRSAESGLKKAVLIAVAFIIVSQTCFFSIAAPAPFAMPEKFIYDLTWTGIKAGTASLELRNDGDTVKILSTAQSAQWVSVFYTVNDQVESTLVKKSPENFVQPAQYRLKIREGRHRRDKEIIFDCDKSKAYYIDHLKNERKDLDITLPVFDALSGFYYVRSLKLSVGQPVYITILDNKKVWNVEVQVVKKEKITLPTGTFDTIVVKPLLKSEGIFYRKGEIFIWLTDDKKHIPVKMQTKVAIGSITATLVNGLY
jgi:Protein of unknown function (DUF3108)